MGQGPSKDETTNAHGRGRYTVSSSHASNDSLSAQSLLTATTNAVINIDHQTSEALSVCSDWDSSFGMLYPFMHLLELSCHGVPWLVFPILWFFTSHLIYHQEMALNIFFLVAVDLLVVYIIKSIVQRPRPEANTGEVPMSLRADQFSFPSGHATRAAFLLIFGLKNFNFGTCWTTVYSAWCCLVITSRLLMGRHYPTDVIAGCCLGVCEYYFYFSYVWVPQPVIMDIIDPFIGHIFL